jgi:hypothetical protein
MNSRNRYLRAARDYLAGADLASQAEAAREAQRAADLAAMEYLRAAASRRSKPTNRD